MSHFDVEVITRAIRSPVRPICRPTLISTPGIASLIAPLSVPTRGGQQYPVKYPLISLSVDPRGTPRKRSTTPPQQAGSLLL